jgi:anti-sigma factor RsiW
MIRDHKFYEMQSAMAATGQLTDAELMELEQHAATCASCRDCIVDMAEVSREFFLAQAGRMKCKATPAGMQERFLERAASAGIAVSRSTSAPLAPLFIRVAVVAVLLAIFTSSSWRVFSAPDAERKAPLDDSTTGSQPAARSEIIPPVVGESATRHAMRKVQLRRSSAARHSALSISSVRSITDERQSHFELNRPFFARYGSSMSSSGSAFWSDKLATAPITSELHAPTSTSFTNAYIANCFGHDEECKPEERAFHLQIKVASLSLLNFPQSLNTESPISGLKFSAPAFHLTPNRVW